MDYKTMRERGRRYATVKIPLGEKGMKIISYDRNVESDI
jgi:hypothetical protein